MNRFRKLASPYKIWMYILVVIPLIIMIALSFTQTDQVSFEGASFTFGNFIALGNATYAKSFLRSMEYSAIATVVCLLIGYPIAYIISTAKFSNKYIVLILIILPMWTNMLLRLKAIQSMIIDEGFIKNTFGVSIDLYGTPSAVIIGMILMYLPFMIFPIFTVLEKIEPSLLEASQDLGANKVKSFAKVTLPLSLKGVTSGIIMVFLPCATGFTVSDVLGAGNRPLIGNKIDYLFMSEANDYNLGSLVSLIIIIIVIGLLFIIGKVDEDGETLL